MAHSFLVYRWKESLLWILWQLTPELTFQPVTDACGDSHQVPEDYLPEVVTFLSFVDQSHAIPFATNPHSIFVFASLQNFVAGVYDTINANWVLAGHKPVSSVIPFIYNHTLKVTIMQSSHHNSFPVCIVRSANYRRLTSRSCRYRKC
jgi:hypothetical protein